MDRIGPAGGSPTIALADGAQGFVDENLASGQEGTLVPAAFMNAVQEELMSLLSAADIAPNISVFNQVLSAVTSISQGAAAAAIAADFQGSLLINGWKSLSGGLILQWGQGVTVTGYLDYVAFPTTFPHGLYCVIAGEKNASGWGPGPEPDIYGASYAAPPLTLSGFLISCAIIQRNGVPIYPATGAGYNYIALGY